MNDVPEDAARTTHRPIIAVLIFLALSSITLAQPIDPAVRGADHFSQDYLRNLVRGRPFDSARTAIQEAYAGDGYLDAVVDGDSASGLSVREGARYTIRTVRLVPDSVARALPATGIDAGELAGEFFSTSAVDDERRRLVRMLNDQGFPLASARLADAAIDDSLHVVDLTFSLVPGDRVRIRQIDIRGNTSTRRSLILTAAAVPPDALFTDELAAQVRARLVRLNLFTDVAEPQLYRADSGGYGLLLTVTEGNTNSFDGIVGFQPGADSDRAGTFTGLVNVSFRNILGTGRRAAVRWQKQTATASLLELRYGEPFIFGIPLDLDLTYRQTQEGETPALLSYVQRFVSGDFYYGLTDAFSIRLGGAYESTLPQADSSQPCFRQLLRSSTLETTIGIGYDTRSNTVNPVSGVRYGTTYSVGAKAVTGPAPCDSGVPRNDTRQRIEFDLDSYLPAFGLFVVAGGIHYGEVRGNLLDESDLFRFGGQANVRGYQENLIRASRRAWGTVELRLLLSATSYAALFFDGGYYRRQADALHNVPELDDWIYGYGAGIQIETPLGLARISYALGKPDNFATGKIFIGLVNQF
jgi:outer membrane protein insertion porin family